MMGAPLGGLTTTVVALASVNGADAAVGGGTVAQQDPFIDPPQQAVPLVRTIVAGPELVVLGRIEVGGPDVEWGPTTHGPVISPPVHTGVVVEDVTIGETWNVDVTLEVRSDVELVPGGCVTLGPAVGNVRFPTEGPNDELREGTRGELVKPMLGGEVPVGPAESDEFAGNGADVPAEGTPVPTGPVAEADNEDVVPVIADVLLVEDIASVGMGLAEPVPAVGPTAVELAGNRVDKVGREAPELAGPVAVTGQVTAVKDVIVVLEGVKAVGAVPELELMLPVKTGLDVELDGKGAAVVELAALDGRPGLRVPGTDVPVVPTASAEDVALPRVGNTADVETGMDGRGVLTVNVKLRVPVGATTTVEFNLEIQVPVSVVVEEVTPVPLDVVNGAVGPIGDVELANVEGGWEAEVADEPAAGELIIVVIEALAGLQVDTADAVGPDDAVALEVEKGGTVVPPGALEPDALVALEPTVDSPVIDEGG